MFRISYKVGGYTVNVYLDSTIIVKLASFIWYPTLQSCLWHIFIKFRESSEITEFKISDNSDIFRKFKILKVTEFSEIPKVPKLEEKWNFLKFWNWNCKATWIFGKYGKFPEGPIYDMIRPKTTPNKLFAITQRLKY